MQPIELTGHKRNITPKHTREDSSQDTMESTISSLKCSFQQEVERENTLRREAAEANAKSLLDMQKEMNHKQTAMDNKLTEMDTTIRTVHEGQTINDTNIQLLMRKLDVFGEQILKMQMNNYATPIKDKETSTAAHMMAITTNVGNETTMSTMSPNDTTQETQPPVDADMEDDINMDAEIFDSIMTDAESKKRIAEQTVLDDISKKKKAQVPLSTRRRSGWRQ